MIQWIWLKCTQAKQPTHGGKALSSSHMTNSETMTWNHVLYEPPVFGNRMTFCGLTAPQTVQSAGLQTAKCKEQRFYLEGHVPWSHIYFFFQFLRLSRGSFTLQTTLMQNIVEHLNQEHTSVKTDRRKQWDMLYLVNNHCYDHICNKGLFPYRTELCKMNAATDLQTSAGRATPHFWNSLQLAINLSAAAYGCGAETGIAANPNP